MQLKSCKIWLAVRKYRANCLGVTLMMVSLLPFGANLRGQDRAQTLPQRRGHINDFAGVVDPATKERLENVLTNLETRTGIVFVVATVKTEGSEDLYDYSLRVAEDWGVGSPQSAGKSLLLLISTDDAKFFSQVSRGARIAFPEGSIGEMGQAMRTLFQTRDFGGGLLAGTRIFASSIGKESDFTFFDALDQKLAPSTGVQVPDAGRARLLTHSEVKSLPAENKRWALIIGVDDYEKDISPLRGSVNDAKALKDVLIRHAGFLPNQVILMTSDASDADLRPTRGNILDALDLLSREIPEGGLLLFSFSGHGISIGNEAFLMPADGRIYQNAQLVRERSVDVSRVRQAIVASNAKQVVMLLDSCRTDPLRAKGDSPNPMTEAFTKGFSFDTRNKDVQAYATIFATSIGDRAYEFFDKASRQYRGFFSYAVEEALRGEAANDKGEVTLGALINYIEHTVSQRVYVEKNEKQIPYNRVEGYRSSELVLAVIPRSVAIPPSDPPVITPELEPDSTAADVERKAFASVKKSTSANDIRAVLKQYPTSLYAGDLRKHLDNVVWNSVKASHDRVRLEEYLDEFGQQGQYASLARAEITKLAPVIAGPTTTNSGTLGSQSVLTPASQAHLALKEFMNGDDESAIKLTTKALRTDKNLALALAISGGAKFYIYSKRKEARAELERAAQLEPNNILYLALLARFYDEDYRKNTYDADQGTAKRLAGQALAVTPKTDVDYYGRGLCRTILARRAYGATGDESSKLWADATSEFSTAITLNPQFWIAYFERGKSYEQQLKNDEAIDDYAKLIELRPNAELGYFYRGDVYGKRREDYDKAISDFDKAIELKPDEGYIFYLRGAVYLKKAEYDRAISDFTKAIQYFPSKSAYRDRAMAEEAMGRKDLAEADKKKADKMRY